MTKILTLISLLCSDPSVYNCKQKYFQCYKAQEKLGRKIEDAIQACFVQIEFKKSLSRKSSN
jgi:hypothetical protein